MSGRLDSVPQDRFQVLGFARRGTLVDLVAAPAGYIAVGCAERRRDLERSEFFGRNRTVGLRLAIERHEIRHSGGKGWERCMTPSEKVAAIEEIKRLKAKYCRLVDYNDRAELRKLFTDDIVYEFENWSKGQGGDAFAGSAETFEDRRSVHRVDMPEIEILSDTTARGIWAMHDIIEYPEASDKTGFRGYGYYHEEYRKVDGGWQISSLFQTRIRTEPLGARDTLG